MENTILETILDEIHDSSNGHLKTLELLSKELIIVNVDTFLFKAIQEILYYFGKHTVIPSTSVPADSHGKIRIRQFNRSEIEFVLTSNQKPYYFQISEIKK